jgi:hypothetical protein
MQSRILRATLSLALLCVTIWACTSENKRQSTSDSTLVSVIDTATSSVITADEYADDINDEDHGSPGLEDTRRSFGDIEPYVQQFLLNLERKQIKDLIDSTGFLMVTPGQGLYPVSTIGSAAEEVLAIKEVTALLNDSSFVKNALPFYTWHYDICSAESLPDGIYLDGPYVEEIGKELWPSDETESLNALNNTIKNLKYRYGKDFNIRFTDKTGETIYLTLRTYLKNEKLFLFMIDQRDCGA